MDASLGSIQEGVAMSGRTLWVWKLRSVGITVCPVFVFRGPAGQYERGLQVKQAMVLQHVRVLRAAPVT
jgi:hypothetical protein